MVHKWTSPKQIGNKFWSWLSFELKDMKFKRFENIWNTFFLKRKFTIFFHFCHFLKKYSVFEAPICGRRPPEHPIIFFGLTKCIFVQLMCWNYMRIYFLQTPGQFLSDTSDFSSFFGNEKCFGRPRAAGDPPEVPQKFLTGTILLLSIHI